MSLEHHSFLLLRTPLQSLDRLFKIDMNKLRPIFQEGLYLSSQAYWQEFQKRNQLIGKDKEKMDLAFSKYWIRSCMRATPYGTFAGSLTVDISEKETHLVLEDNSEHTRNIRVDMNYVSEIINALLKLPHIAQQLKFYPNNSIYELPNGFRYAEYSISNNTRNYQLTSVNNASYIKAILLKAAEGATISELIELLITTEGVSAEEAAAFISDLLLSQLLISELEPCVTGKDSLDALIAQLEPLKDIEELKSRLKNIQQLICNPKEGVAYYQHIENELKQLGVSIEVPQNTLQTDLFLTARSAVVNHELVDAITLQAESLTYLARENRNAELMDFKTKFSARYEDAEMPLSIVLDADLGIGYAGVRDESAGGGDLIDDLAALYGSGQRNGRESSYLEQFSLVKYEDYAKNKRTHIEVTDEDLKGFKDKTDKFRFPNSMYLMGSLMKKDMALSSENFMFSVVGIGGPSAGNLLGRFTHGDERLCNFTKELLKSEEALQPDVIYAEIAHLPQARIGNILLRPVLRAYEIPYVGKSGAPLEAQIPISDLMVGVRNNEVYLRSKKHNKVVIPRLTTAHNFGHRSLPVYKFLCDLQAQGNAYANVWDWGTLVGLKHLPRVTYKNLVLQKATWKIVEKDIDDLPKLQSEYPDYFRSFCIRLGLPKRVVYAESDNELAIDFEEATGINLFLHYLKRNKRIQLEEFLFTEENCIVHDIAGCPYTNEMIIPLSRTPTINKKSHKDQPATESVLIKRKFSPNSEWQYFKVYCGSKTAERILAETVLPFVEMGVDKQLFEQFFFIRYRDDAGHFRIRFYNKDLSKQSTLQSEFLKVLQPMLDTGLIDKVIVDTYSRELERYGSDLIEDAETLFFNDSLAILRFISLLSGEDSGRYRLLFALRGIDMLLDDFGFSLSEKKDLLKSMQAGFFKEFGGRPVLQKQLNEKYRKHQQDIFQHLNPGNDIANEIDEAVAIFAIRSEMNEPVVAAIKSKLRDSMAERLSELLPSYIHMFMNRMFIAQQRKYELVVYHFLDKYYTSKTAIASKSPVQSVSQSQPV